VIYLDDIFLEAAAEIKEIEAGYVDHPSDPGGKTRWGISEWLARAYGYNGEMKNLSWPKAKEIYYKEYWTRNKYNKIKNRQIAGEVFEQAVNLPIIELRERKVLKANVYLQKAYNLVTRKKQITVDGLIGPQTLKAINSCSRVIAFLNLLNGLQAKHYLEVVEKYPKLRSFVVGWFNKRITIKNRG
jgi:lysozyme family protein